MKRIVAFFIVLVLFVGSSMSVFADSSVPTETFTHLKLPDGSYKAVATRPLYEAYENISFRSLGIEQDVGRIIDSDCDESGNVYILTDTGSVIVLDKNEKYSSNLELFDESGEKIDFAGSKGIYCYKDNEIYISDTENSRVIHCVNGVVSNYITLPNSDVIPENFVFKPIRVARDSQGYLYILSEGSYYGALLYDSNNEFVGFYGANSVSGTILSTLSYVWDKLTQNDIKRAKKVKSLPFQFSDICIDKYDFTYTCTGKNSDGDIGQIRMLSPGGSNILSGSDSINFGENEKVVRRKNKISQNFSSVQADGNGFIYALDSALGLIYIYDTDNNMIAAFAGGRGLGSQLGVFSNAQSLTLSNDKLYVTDSILNTLTVFKRTEFGDLLINAQEKTLKSSYKESESLWKKVLKKDSMNQLAKAGLAKAAYAKNDFDTALKYSKDGCDKETYSLALKEKHTEFAAKYFVYIFLLVIFIIAAITFLIIISIKKKLVLIKNNKLRLLFSGMIHPFNSFNEIKYKKQGSILIAVAMNILYFVSAVLFKTLGDFRYSGFDSSTYNAIYQLVQTVGIVVLWSVANWAVCTLKQGNGKLKEVYIVSSYSCLPLIIYNIVATPISHFIASESSTLLSGLNIISIIFAGIMITVSMMVIHGFSFPRMLVTSIVSVLLMILIVFLFLMIGVLLSQFWTILSGMILELTRL